MTTLDSLPALPIHVALLALLVLALLVSPATTAAEPETGGGWVCPPCSHVDVDVVYDAAGTCPVCGMELVRRDQVVHAAILVFDGVQIIDYAAPYEVFGQARFYTYLVSPDGAPITTSMDMHVTPHFSFRNAPRPDVLLVPGGDVHHLLDDARALRWVGEAASGADHVLSVCNGAFILAEAGLLDGLRATTFHRLLEKLAMQYPGVDVVRGTRFVDNGKIITSAGLSAGIDGAIHVVEKIEGRSEAERLARHLEYAWERAAGGGEGEPVGRKLSAAELDDYDGLYELEGDRRVRVVGSAEDGILYALVGGRRDPLLPLGSDRFLTTAGDEVVFVRDERGDVEGYRSPAEADGRLYRRLPPLPEMR